jgi:tagatose 1,6-diphosphate aldolase
LTHEDVRLFYVGVMPGDDERGLAPYYHHRILVDSADVGHINFKVSDSDHVRLYAGHVGFEVKPMYHGHGYASKACRALVPLMNRYYDEVIFTADPDNLASIRTIEGLGACFLDEQPVPPTDPQHTRGSRIKRRYGWRQRTVSLSGALVEPGVSAWSSVSLSRTPETQASQTAKCSNCQPL